MLIHGSFELARTTLKKDDGPKLHFSWKQELSKFSFQYEVLGEMVWIGSIDKKNQVSVVIDGVDPEGWDVLETRKYGCLGTAVSGVQEVKANEKGGCGMSGYGQSNEESGNGRRIQDA
jgi:hypothetical protein